MKKKKKNENRFCWRDRHSQRHGGRYDVYKCSVMKRNWVFTNLSHKVLYINSLLKSLVSLQIQDTSHSVLSSCHKHFIPKDNPTINPRMELALSSSTETVIEDNQSKDVPWAKCWEYEIELGWFKLQTQLTLDETTRQKWEYTNIFNMENPK